MPALGDTAHYCNQCFKKSAQQSANGGFCKKHHEVCDVHPWWFKYVGQACEQCNKEARAELVEQRKEKERALLEETAKKENEWFQRSGKERKPRSKG